ncbi:hypothetical protein CRG98_043365 [Punica granatum]|uniref:Gnk2-homologous domain-containing protein n=1 Tax=Punica granatum TaxID=22663 RepID=A0A2I0HXA9_PUNGR|nr:hypothetical protein CRG98_043365 [Punica granatum]
MSLPAEAPLLLPCICVLLLLASTATSSTDSFVFGGCSQLKYTPGSPYETAVNSLLTSLVNSAEFSTYNNFTVPGPGSAPEDTVYGLFQCRGDLSADDCSKCVTRAVSRLGTLCVGSCGGAMQLDGCFIKYDNTSFLGVEDKAKCGPLIGLDSEGTTERDSLLGSVVGSDGAYKPYRAGWSGDARAVAQCVQDLSASECQDCLTEAITQLKTNCQAAKWGDMFLGKCYVRYSEGGDHSHDGHGSSNDDEIEKTLAILIGLIAGVALIIVFLSFLARVCDRGKGGK